MYLWFKLFHVAAVVMFLGNIVTGLFWHGHATRTKDPRLLAHTMEGIIRSDRIFTIPGVIVITAMGFLAALHRGYPILRTGWIAATIVLFSLSGWAFGARVAPLQRALRDLARDGAAAGSFEYDRYHALARRWEFWGAVALGLPVAGFVLMVLKPF
jgi:uncharacterized membrane protein